MRRIYESAALDRDDEDPFRPGEHDATVEPEAMRSVPGAWLSRTLIPHAIRHRCIRLRVTTPRSTYPSGTHIPFTVTIKNVMPFPISIQTPTLEHWAWSVDGHRDASYISETEPPEESSTFNFGRGERKRFEKRWNQMFRTSVDEWVPAEPGEYDIRAWMSVSTPHRSGLSDEVTVRIDPAGTIEEGQ